MPIVSDRPRLIRAALILIGMAAGPCLAAAQSDSTRPRTTAAHRAEAPGISTSALRSAVEREFPAALTGTMGRRPMVWILADGQDRVLRTATGRNGLRPGPTGAETLDWEAATAKLSGMPPSARPGDFLQWGLVAAGSDTVDVVWVRVNAGLPGR